MRLKAIAIVALGAALTPAAHAADAQQGKQLHNDNCVRCHSSDVYTREDRRINSLSSLETQVRRCAVNLGAQWMEDEIADVTAYLNQSFYHFE